MPDDIKSQVKGMLSAVLTGPAGDEVMTVKMVTQVCAWDGALVRYMFNLVD